MYKITLEDHELLHGNYLREYVLDNIPDTVDQSKVIRWLTQQFGVYSERPDLAEHNPHEGYIYIIKDPRLPKDKNIFFVGSSREPWTAVKRHARRSTVKKLRKYMEELLPALGGKVVIRGKEPVDYFEGYIDSLTVLEPELGCELPWEVIDYHENKYESVSVEATSDLISVNAVSQSKRVYWENRLRNEGHPILNKSAGRPRT